MTYIARLATVLSASLALGCGTLDDASSSTELKASDRAELNKLAADSSEANALKSRADKSDFEVVAEAPKSCGPYIVSDEVLKQREAYDAVQLEDATESTEKRDGTVVHLSSAKVKLIPKNAGEKGDDSAALAVDVKYTCTRTCSTGTQGTVCDSGGCKLDGADCTAFYCKTKSGPGTCTGMCTLTATDSN